MSEKINELLRKKYALEKEQLKLAEQIRYEALLQIEKKLMPPIPFGFICFELNSYGQIKEREVDRIELNYCKEWRFFDGSDYLFTIGNDGLFNYSSQTYETMEKAEQELKNIQARKAQDEERKRLEKIEAAKKVLAEAENL